MVRLKAVKDERTLFVPIFQFLVVRLKDKARILPENSYEFQFLVVRLKGGHIFRRTTILKFQFLVVRLKEINGEEIDFSILISIPCGSIKR